jgi:Ser/Thr protein kinase RdoA (MazF antagonist)
MRDAEHCAGRAAVSATAPALSPPSLRLAHAALGRYGVRSRRLRRLAAQVVRVDAVDGSAYALRCRPWADRAFGDVPLELAWTAALRRDTDLEPPEPVPGHDGALVQEVAVPEGAGPHDCVLFRWIPGVELGERLTPANLRRLGVLAARLHEHAATFRPPAELPVRTLDQLIGRGEREVLFSHEHPLFLPPARRAVFEQVAARFRRTVDELYADPAGRRVIHADLTPENVKLHRGQLRPLDFYEAIWGYPVQDVALALYDLRHFVDCRPHGYAALRDAFAHGYGSRLPWPETHAGQIDTLVAGRRLRQANWVLRHETAPFAADPAAVPDPAAIAGFFGRLEAEFRSLLEHGTTGSGP